MFANESSVLPAVLLHLQYTCKYAITVVNKATGAVIPSATINGQWSSKKNTNGWPYKAAATTNNSGYVMVTATKTLSSGSGNGCTYTVNTISKVGMNLDTTAGTLRAASMSW
jgi:hypothetical protein